MTPKEAKQRLLEKGMTQKTLAAKLRVPLHVVKDVLNGRVKGHFGDSHRVAKYLGIAIRPREPYGSMKSKRRAETRGHADSST
jgi:gp16 family phage-associated protein